MSIEALIRDQYLSYDLISGLKNPKRFWYQCFHGKVYIFDSLSVNIYILQGNMAGLFQAKDREEFITFLNTINWDEIKSAYSIVDAILKPPAIPMIETKSVINTIHLDINNQCNLACKYCFKDKKRFELKDWSIVTRALEYLIYDCGKDAPEYEIGYCYTSEPLLGFQNLKKLIVQVTHLSKQINKKIAVFFTTNGTILSDEILRYYNRVSRRFNISVDGCQSIHDEVRQFQNGKGTFSVIQENIQRLKENNYTLLGSSVLTSKYPYPAQVLNSLLELGFEDVLIKPARFGDDLSFNEKNISNLKAGYQEYFKMFYQDIHLGCIERINKYRNDYPLKFFKNILLKQHNKRRCYWGLNKIAMNHLGELYPCDSALNMEELKIGDVYNGIDWRKFTDLLEIDTRGDCKSCWAKYICGGTCYLQSWITNQDISTIDPAECELNKFLIKSSLELLILLIDEKGNMSKLREIFAGPSFR